MAAHTPGASRDLDQTDRQRGINQTRPVGRETYRELRLEILERLDHNDSIELRTRGMSDLVWGTIVPQILTSDITSFHYLLKAIQYNIIE